MRAECFGYGLGIEVPDFCDNPTPATARRAEMAITRTILRWRRMALLSGHRKSTKSHIRCLKRWRDICARAAEEDADE